MHPAFMTAIATAQQQDKLTRAAASRRARQARPARPARAGFRLEHGALSAVRRHHGPAEPLSPAVSGSHPRPKIGV
jgi:hypothetical protein